MNYLNMFLWFVVVVLASLLNNATGSRLSRKQMVIGSILIGAVIGAAGAFQ